MNGINGITCFHGFVETNKEGVKRRVICENFTTGGVHTCTDCIPKVGKATFVEDTQAYMTFEMTYGKDAKPLDPETGLVIEWADYLVRFGGWTEESVASRARLIADAYGLKEEGGRRWVAWSGLGLLRTEDQSITLPDNVKTVC